jgi:O-antigen/teichoic acid export membrane protein
MKRLAAFTFYAVGAIAIVYLALYVYSAFTGRQLQPGDPIHIFRKPDAPNYSWVLPAIPGTSRSNLAMICWLALFRSQNRAHPLAVAAARG